MNRNPLKIGMLTLPPTAPYQLVVKYWEEPTGVPPTTPRALMVGSNCSCCALLNFCAACSLNFND